MRYRKMMHTNTAFSPQDCICLVRYLKTSDVPKTGIDRFPRAFPRPKMKNHFPDMFVKIEE